jgi:hypothetical protein
VPEQLVRRICVVQRRRRELAIATPARGGVSNGQDADRARLRGNALPAIESAGQLAERGIAATDRLLVPPGNAAPAGTEVHRFLHFGSDG